jgi:5-formyltetrahydrofolate cyclo-ligase
MAPTYVVGTRDRGSTAIAAPRFWTPILSIADEKNLLRAEALARRDALSADARAAASETIAGRALAMRRHFPPGPVSAFWPIRSEVDTLALLRRLHDHGVTVLLPRVRLPLLQFCAWRPGAALAKGAFGLREPEDSAEILEPATLFVPLAAFDRAGHRIGYGKGHYDRALAALRRRGGVLAIGLGFATQEIARTPVEPHDEPLDAIVTEDEWIDIPSRRAAAQGRGDR